MSLRGGTTKQSDKQYYVYMMMSINDQVIYIGVTDNLIRRVYEHRNKLNEGFTNRYNVVKLVYFEQCEETKSAISREKQIKGGSRKKKIDLIKSKNSELNDLYNEIIK